MDIDCDAYVSQEVDGRFVTLSCWLPLDHDGPHYDQADDLTWYEGRWRADEARDAEAEARWEGTHPVAPPDPDSRGGT